MMNWASVRDQRSRQRWLRGFFFELMMVVILFLSFPDPRLDVYEFSLDLARPRVLCMAHAEQRRFVDMLRLASFGDTGVKLDAGELQTLFLHQSLA